MSKSKIARSEKRHTKPAPREAEPASERRIKAAPATTAEPKEAPAVREGAQRVEDYRRFRRRDAEEVLASVRHQLAELWWYGEMTFAKKSGVDPDEARDEMAHAACEIGKGLNLVTEMIRELAQSDAQLAVEKAGGAS